ncbi:hypothetical protein Syun_016201 [Stephania yunnanensis]|uniref:Uncharacterized protein n=1 Tax=Stephania yunnanensis TaxID=152371 RepID=A0AAP0P281_9MAGN
MLEKARAHEQRILARSQTSNSRFNIPIAVVDPFNVLRGARSTHLQRSVKATREITTQLKQMNDLHSNGFVIIFHELVEWEHKSKLESLLFFAHLCLIEIVPATTVPVSTVLHPPSPERVTAFSPGSTVPAAVPPSTVHRPSLPPPSLPPPSLDRPCLHQRCLHRPLPPPTLPSPSPAAIPATTVILSRLCCRRISPPPSLPPCPSKSPQRSHASPLVSAFIWSLAGPSPVLDCLPAVNLKNPSLVKKARFEDVVVNGMEEMESDTQFIVVRSNDLRPLPNLPWYQIQTLASILEPNNSYACKDGKVD